ncbi:CBS domain-containing protein [Niabella drilacis]|uniref:CBS domain-containing protein n=1 Tax=Niabella drilacis (strain DSM 25811 / CCM 8410 / CCUG 62505 / LMG 26954 / E90) TaxID=1285928 RepID=A0A1G6JJ66_NIADE|nr:CBS domain-containing protein [Niabella drilacis]SDC18822.1 CBS domain-containing protein [Niabella drilacis]
MAKVSNILARKGHDTISIAPTTSVYQALELMADKNIGALVVKKGENYLGIITERDYSRKVILKGKHSSDTTVEEIMSTDLPHISPEDSVEHCMELMSDKNIRYLPVFINLQLAGIISISDVVKETILQQKETISHLQDYIHSNG